MSKWRRPKLINKNAWRRISSGDLWWDHKAIERAALRRKHWLMITEARLAAKKRWEEDCAKGVHGCQIPKEIMYELKFGFPPPNKGYNS